MYLTNAVHDYDALFSSLFSVACMAGRVNDTSNVWVKCEDCCFDAISRFRSIKEWYCIIEIDVIEIAGRIPRVRMVVLHLVCYKVLVSWQALERRSCVMRFFSLKSLEKLVFGQILFHVSLL